MKMIVGGLFRSSFWSEGMVGKISTPPIWNSLETWNSVSSYKHIICYLKMHVLNTNSEPLKFAYISILLKKSVFLGKNISFLKKQ